MSQEQAPKAGTEFKDPAKQAMVLTALYIAQEQNGFLSEEAVRRVAERLHLPIAQVYATASFYSLFRTQARARYHIQVCEGLSCALCDGAERVLRYLEQKLGIASGQMTKDGVFSLETVQCLASCGTSPAVRVNDELYDNLDFVGIDRLLDQLSGRV